MAFKTPAETAAEATLAKAGWKRDKKTGLWKCFRDPRRGEIFSGTAVDLARSLKPPAS
ncbi:hypothetical protein [Aureimonas pseudogalii]|uniref:Uncharacterized protein n=1 Tax=Aureimonas pseudogalii TaxID=1744844 RepID=A0A7W6H2N4_9HYPH|nr:hypothetical protein [Aureimonas pseudogalii]MBB3996830.1 hypothetical protein [Aureimonas pseudogalii]